MVIWSLFDGSGIMGLPWAEAGHTVYCFNADEGNHGAYKIRMEHENLHYVNIWIDDFFYSGIRKRGIPDPQIIFAFPDCTMLTVAGAKHERTDEAIRQAIRNAERVEAIANHVGARWLVENPVGKMSSLWRKPDYYFDPYLYGGYMTGNEEQYHPRMPARDAYTKKTYIWGGNGFVMPEPKPVPHIGKFWGWAYLGGKSPKTKQLRSLTPRGFARAVFEANK
jgi:hypothetical protein